MACIAPVVDPSMGVVKVMTQDFLELDFSTRSTTVTNHESERNHMVDYAKVLH